MTTSREPEARPEGQSPEAEESPRVVVQRGLYFDELE